MESDISTNPAQVLRPGLRFPFLHPQALRAELDDRTAPQDLFPALSDSVTPCKAGEPGQPVGISSPNREKPQEWKAGCPAEPQCAKLHAQPHLLPLEYRKRGLMVPLFLSLTTLCGY